MEPLLMTLIDPGYLDFKVAIFFDIEYLRNDTRQSHNYYRTSIGSHMRSIDSNGDISNDLDGPLTRSSRSQHFLKSII